MGLYCTVEEAREWAGNPELDIPARDLRRAEMLVDWYTRMTRFDVDPVGAPSDPAVALAFMEAVADTVTTWLEADKEAADSPLVPGIKQATLDGASYTRDEAYQVGADRTRLSVFAEQTLDALHLTEWVDVHG